ncbi:MAG: hypothetical protein ACXVGH_13430 [Mycobacteriales bacterium]
MSRPVLRALALAGAAAVALGTPATAMAASHAHAKPSKPAHPAHPVRKPAPFTAVGVVTAVDPAAGTVTVADTGGSRDLHGRTVVVSVAGTTRVTLDDAPATLAQLAAGDAVTANGVRSASGALTARAVNATSPAPAPVPTDSPTPVPTDSPTPAV